MATMNESVSMADWLRAQAEIERLRERVYWAESSLDTWDDERDASYWQRYPERMKSPFQQKQEKP